MVLDVSDLIASMGSFVPVARLWYLKRRLQKVDSEVSGLSNTLLFGLLDEYFYVGSSSACVCLLYRGAF